MPRGDANGPLGMGPMTGRGAGYCTGYRQTEYPQGNQFPGLRMRRGYGGWRQQGCFNTGPYDETAGPSFGAPMGQKDNRRFWQRQADMLKQRLEVVNRRIDDLEAAEEKSE
jgi:hypothetical protein